MFQYKSGRTVFPSITEDLQQTVIKPDQKRAVSEIENVDILMNCFYWYIYHV